MRNIDKAGPWCWLEKQALRNIRDSFEGNTSSAIAVYVALAEIASDGGKETFETTHKWISHLSGVGVRTVGDRVRELAELGLVTIKTPPLRGPATYTLKLFGNNRRTISNNRRTFGKFVSTQLPTSEEKKKGESDLRSAINAEQSEDGNQVAGSAFREARKGLL
jgi:hypothetical protein